MSAIRDFKYKFKNFNAFEKIIVVNIIVFIIGALITVFGRTEDSLSFLKLPADFLDFIQKPWTIITYGFVHYGFFHILFNLLFLRAALISRQPVSRKPWWRRKEVKKFPAIYRALTLIFLTRTTLPGSCA